MIIKSNNIERTLEKITKSCRKGTFIYLVCKKKQYSKIKKFLRNKLSYNRGIFYYKGMIVLSTRYRKHFNKYFDKVLIIWSDK